MRAQKHTPPCSSIHPSILQQYTLSYYHAHLTILVHYYHSYILNTIHKTIYISIDTADHPSSNTYSLPPIHAYILPSIHIQILLSTIPTIYPQYQLTYSIIFELPTPFLRNDEKGVSLQGDKTTTIRQQIKKKG